MATQANIATVFIACAAALNTHEILERIFLHLPLIDLLIRPTRVSKHWKAMWEGSVKIQCVLFLERMPDVGKVTLDTIQLKGARCWVCMPEDKVILKHRPIFNPILSPFMVPCGNGGVAFKHSFIAPFDPNNSLHARVSTAKLSQHRFWPRSSISSMQIMRPAALYTHFICEEDPNGDVEPIEVPAENADGVCVRDIRKAAMGDWADCPNCPIQGYGEGCWRWGGEDDVEFVDGGEDTMTGWEMWAELVMRSETVKVDEA